jgi:transposase
MGQNKYSIALKKTMVARFLEEPEKKIGDFSRENGVPESCLRNWIRESESGILDGMNKPKHYRYWTLEEKFSAILEFEKLSNEERGKWLRKHGMKIERIKLWQDEIYTNLKALNEKGLSSLDNKKIDELKKELDRKNKALAEASALLFTKKKLEAIFGENKEEK